MKNWVMSLNGAIALSVIAFLTFLGRAFMDWWYEYPHQDPAGNWDTPGALIYMALAGGWLWGLLAVARGSRWGLVVSLVAVLARCMAMELVQSDYFNFQRTRDHRQRRFSAAEVANSLTPTDWV